MADDGFSLAEAKQRIYNKFLQKLDAAHPGHPWIPEELRKEWDQWKWKQKATQEDDSASDTAKT